MLITEFCPFLNTWLPSHVLWQDLFDLLSFVPSLLKAVSVNAVHILLELLM